MTGELTKNLTLVRRQAWPQPPPPPPDDRDPWTRPPFWVGREISEHCTNLTGIRPVSVRVA